MIATPTATTTAATSATAAKNWKSPDHCPDTAKATAILPSEMCQDDEGSEAAARAVFGAVSVGPIDHSGDERGGEAEDQSLGRVSENGLQHAPS